MYLEAIAIMLTLHLIADYPMQGDFLANIKGQNFFLLLCHSFMWAGIVYFGLMYLGMATPWEFYFLAVDYNSAVNVFYVQVVFFYFCGIAQAVDGYLEIRAQQS